MLPTRQKIISGNSSFIRSLKVRYQHGAPYIHTQSMIGTRSQTEEDEKKSKKMKRFFTSNTQKFQQNYISQSLPSTLIQNNKLLTIHQYHTSIRSESTTLVLGLGTIALTAKAGQYAIQAYEEYKKNLPEDDATSTAEETRAKSQTQSEEKASSTDAGTKADTSGKRKNVFQEWFGVGVGSKYYEGGFEEKMTRREAALILGVRESSTAKRIKEAHRKILILNHPDTGGSTYIASKLNEAKELLLKGKE